MSKAVLQNFEFRPFFQGISFIINNFGSLFRSVLGIIEKLCYIKQHFVYNTANMQWQCSILLNNVTKFVEISPWR